MKKLISLILATVMLMSCLGICVSAEDEIKYGDANNDGKINLRDVSIIMKYIARWRDLSKFNFDAADVTHDDKVNLHDATKIIKYIAKWEEYELIG